MKQNNNAAWYMVTAIGLLLLFGLVWFVNTGQKATKAGTGNTVQVICEGCE